MTAQEFQRLTIFPLFSITLLVAGCTPRVSPPTPPPTTSPSIPATTIPAPTATPRSTPTGSRVSPTPLRFQAEPFSHPGGLFEILPPDGWKLDWDAGSMILRLPEDPVSLSVRATNTGLTLSHQEFQAFVSARNDNVFGRFAGFEILSSEFQEEAAAAQIKAVYLSDEGEVTVRSIYRRQDQAVFTVDFWSPTAAFDGYWNQLIPILNEINFDRESAEALPVYAWVYEFVDPQDAFRLEVPTAWVQESFSADFTELHTFQSPSAQASIDIIRYDEDRALTNQEAALIVQTLLDLHYAEDLRIIADEIQPDGSERLTWISPAEGRSGRTYFQIVGTPLLVMTVQWADEHAAIYSDVLQHSVQSFSLRP